MKIEKLNDRQIRCTLTREDLSERHIKLSELAYGSEKTKALFHDMMEQASLDFGFDTEDIPIMIEAIPLSAEKVVLIITKVDSPEELDTRFSEFSQFEEEDCSFCEEESLPAENDIPPELRSLLDQIRQELIDAADAKKAASDKTAPRNQICAYSFDDLELAIAAAKAIAPSFSGISSLYKDVHSQTYYLFLHQAPHTDMEFNRIMIAMTSYLHRFPCTDATEAYFKEHGRVVVSRKALATLAQL